MGNNWTVVDLQAQYDRALAQGWMPLFEKSAAAHHLPTEFLLAIASRESGIQNIRGDLRDGDYRGFGVMQIDIGAFPEFCKSWAPSQIAASIEYGAGILAAARDALARFQILDFKSIAASYNTGVSNVRRSYALHRDVDSTTTGGNYGRDVLNRMDVFVQVRLKDRPKAA